ncbi:MAG: FliM/FliN family flagellar motor switch protein [Acidobacteria bacterium]|nr:FliM/FliN family flagellar motor switch protein [Acidobacteriota bacterium]
MPKSLPPPSILFEDAIAELLPFIDISIPCSVELGRTKVTIRTLLDLEVGSLIELPKSAGEPLDFYANNYLIMQAEITVMDDVFGLRITELVNPWRKI